MLPLTLLLFAASNGSRDKLGQSSSEVACYKLLVGEDVSLYLLTPNDLEMDPLPQLSGTLKQRNPKVLRCILVLTGFHLLSVAQRSMSSQQAFFTLALLAV